MDKQNFNELMLENGKKNRYYFSENVGKPTLVFDGNIYVISFSN